MAGRREIEVIARGLVEAGGVVLLCRNLAHGHSYLPGGHVEFGEPASVALAREFQEEAGLVVEVGDLLLAHEHVFRQQAKMRHELNLVFSVRLEGMSTEQLPRVVSCEQEIAFEWRHTSQLGRAKLVPDGMVMWLEERGRGQVRSFLTELRPE